MNRNEEKLQTNTTEPQKESPSRHTDSVQELEAIAECLLFQNSFRLGTRMMLDILDERIL